MGSEVGKWSPLAPEELPAVLADARGPWWLAGGWAVDAHLGKQTREHSDVDVLILRRDLLTFRESLQGWDVHAADPPGRLRPWPRGQVLSASVHDVWVRRSSREDWSLQIMIDDTYGPDWLYRREPRIRRPITQISGPSSDDLRQVLAPEIQLLAKSTDIRPKDQQDFNALLPVLLATERHWLCEALDLTSPDHPWLGQLR